MPRKRLRPEYVQRHYTYSAVPLGPVPQSVWDTARNMQTLWNMLVVQHEKLREQYDTTTPRADVRALYDGFWADAYLTIREEGRALGLSAWPKWHIYDTFQATMRRFAKHLGGPPKEHRGLRRIFIPHRTEPGGVSTDWLWADNPRKHSAILPRKPGHHHQEAYMTVGTDRVPLLVMMHRPLPQDAILKRLALIGRFEPQLRRPGETGWHWQMQLTIEMPPPVAKPRVYRTCGLDLGWRVRDDGLRLAVITDGQSTWEWLLPFDLSNAAIRHHRKFFARHGNDIPEATGDWRALWNMQRSMDEELEACKARLRERTDVESWPADARDIMAHLTKVRMSGLKRLLFHLTQAGIVCEPLYIWDVRHTVRARRLRASQLRIQRIQDYLYRMLADWLVRHYDVISWEGDLGLKELAEAPHDPDQPKDYALSESQKYRQQAGLSRLRRYIQEAVARDVRVLLEQDAAYTTRTCATCGAPVPNTSNLRATCLEGHEEDQDVTAALNLWHAIDDGERDCEGPVPQVDRDVLRKAVHRLV